MGFLGRHEIDDLLTFPANTHTAATGAATDADAVPAYRVYEDETATPILTGTMALLDGTNTAGFYSEQITLSAANGFEVGKSYTIYISATVASVVGTMSHTFQVEAALATQASVNTIDDFLDTEIADIQSRLPAALVSGRMDASVGAAAANAINASALAVDAVTEIQSGLATAASLTTVESKIDTIDTNVDSILADTGTDGVVVAAGSKSGYSLSSAGIQAIWDALTSALTTVGSIGKRIADNLDATISSRLASVSYTTPPAVGAIADAVWDETLADHLAAGSTGNALNAAGSAGDPWSTALPGAYGSGSAGNIIGNNLNATVSSRATPAQVNTEADTALADVGLTTTVTGRIDAAISTRLASAGYTAPPTVADILAGVIEGTITLKGALRLTLAALAGKVTGGGTATVIFRDVADAKARITATVDANGNRTAITRDITD